jgi:hypothetical protein
MGRKAISKKHKLAKQRERQRKYLSNDDALARTREGNRFRIQERRRREQQASLGPQTLPGGMATRAEIMRYVNEEEIDELATSARKENEGSMQFMTTLIQDELLNERGEQMRCDHGDDIDDDDDDAIEQCDFGYYDDGEFGDGGFGDRGFGDGGFGDEGFDHMESMTMMTIITDMYR